MKLRTKVFAILGFGLLGITAGFYGLARGVILQRFLVLEEEFTTRNMDRVLKILNNELATLSTLAADYSRWDDTYAFMQSQDPAYLTANFPATGSTLTGLEINLLLLVSSRDEIVFSQRVDLETEATLPLSPELTTELIQQLPQQSVEAEGGLQTTLTLSDGIYLVTAQPILPSAGTTGASRGRLIMGRALDAPKLERIQGITSLPQITLTAWNGVGSQSADIQRVATSLKADPATQTAVATLSSDEISAYTLLRNPQAQPEALVQTVEPRTLYAQGQTTLSYLVVGILIAGGALGGVMLLLLENLVLSRVERLAIYVNQQGQDLDKEAEPLIFAGDDEFSNLAESFNRLLLQIRSLVQQLRGTTQQLEDQNQLVEAESRNLQQDIQEILAVVSQVEEGDLAVQAPVSDRITGLVADTLNRLIEELNQVLLQVQSSAVQITRESLTVEQLSQNVSQQAEQQAESVQQMQKHIQQVASLSQRTSERTAATEQVIRHSQAMVQQGQIEMTTMSNKILALQQGAEQIVRRSQTLNDFIDLAAQFSRDQKRVSAMTRVLALNASMLAARASGQQDPVQFASIAHEFETIAEQVNELATQTSQSLVRLQQRTDQIQTVLSGLQYDMTQITELVQRFSQGVDQSTQVFTAIRTVTDEVAQLGTEVLASSLTITSATQTTLETMDRIADITATTEAKAELTAEQAQRIRQQAQLLQDRIQFFRFSHSSASPSKAEISANEIPENGFQLASLDSLLSS